MPVTAGNPWSSSVHLYRCHFLAERSGGGETTGWLQGSGGTRGGVAAPSPYFQFPTAPATELPCLSLASKPLRGACQTGLPEA